MDLCKSSKCLIRKKLVVLTPEEKVRQWLLHRMIFQLRFPKGLIGVEKSIGFRRVDVVCYQSDMTPLLLVECKKDALQEKALQQALGYLQTVPAPFFALVCGETVSTFWFEEKVQKQVLFLPSYQELVCVASRL